MLVNYRLVNAEHLSGFYVDGYGLIPKEDLTDNHAANIFFGGSQYIERVETAAVKSVNDKPTEQPADSKRG